MKYVSEITGKEYISEKECLKAEAEYKKEQEIKAKEEAERVSNISKKKKELAKEIELAEEKIKEANKDYNLAKERAKKIAEEADKQIDEIFSTAEEKIKEAEEHKLNCIQKWNKEFGTYNKIYTGKQALEEYEKAIARFERFFNHFWF